MTSVVRYSTRTNATGAPIVVGGATVSQGQDYADQIIEVTLAAADVGTAAGQTRGATGMIFAEIYGAVVKRVTAEILRPSNGFDYIFLGDDNVTANIGFSVTNANGKSTIRLKDTPTGGGGQIAANDKIVATVYLGNS